MDCILLILADVTAKSGWICVTIGQLTGNGIVQMIYKLTGLSDVSETSLSEKMRGSVERAEREKLVLLYGDLSTMIRVVHDCEK